MKNIRDSGWWNEEHKRWRLECVWAIRNKAEGIGIWMMGSNFL